MERKKPTREEKAESYTDKFINEYEDLLKIDQDDLDNCVIENPGVYWQVCKYYKLALSIRDEMKDQLKQTDSALYLQHKANLEGAGERVTEARLAAEVEVDLEHVGALKEFRSAERNAGLLEALKVAFEQRSFALRELVELHVLNYNTMNYDGKSAHASREANAAENRKTLARERKPLTKKRGTKDQ